MQERVNARVILLDADDRLLLFKGRTFFRPQGPQHWFTVGGGLENGENIEEAAIREAIEETGFDDIRMGPKIWIREVALLGSTGALYLSVEHFFIARCRGGEVSRERWTGTELNFTDDVRWWSIEELADTTETIWPANLATLLPPILAGNYPLVPRRWREP